MQRETIPSLSTGVLLVFLGQRPFEKFPKNHFFLADAGFPNKVSNFHPPMSCWIFQLENLSSITEPDVLSLYNMEVS